MIKVKEQLKNIGYAILILALIHAVARTAGYGWQSGANAAHPRVFYYEMDQLETSDGVTLL